MKSIEEIIKVFDEELIENGMSFLRLEQANKLLVQKGFITIREKSDQVLKRSLEEGEIPHTYQTGNSPKQWRIPLSKVGEEKLDSILHGKMGKEIENQVRNKILKNQKYVTTCPICNRKLEITYDFLNHYYLACIYCLSTFKNPFRKNYKSYISGKDQVFKVSSTNTKAGLSWWADKRNNKYVYWGITIMIIAAIIIGGIIQTVEDNDPLIKELNAKYVGRVYNEYVADELIIKYGYPQTLSGTDNNIWVAYFPKGNFTMNQTKGDYVITKFEAGRNPRGIN